MNYKIILLFGIGILIMILGVSLTQVHTTPVIYSNNTDCNISTMNEFYTAYQEFRIGCPKETNLTSYAFFKYKP